MGDLIMGLDIVYIFYKAKVIKENLNLDVIEKRHNLKLF